MFAQTNFYLIGANIFDVYGLIYDCTNSFCFLFKQKRFAEYLLLIFINSSITYLFSCFLLIAHYLKLYLKCKMWYVCIIVVLLYGLFECWYKPKFAPTYLMCIHPFILNKYIMQISFCHRARNEVYICKVRTPCVPQSSYTESSNNTGLTLAARSRGCYGATSSIYNFLNYNFLPKTKIHGLRESQTWPCLPIIPLGGRRPHTNPRILGVNHKFKNEMWHIPDVLGIPTF